MNIKSALNIASIRGGEKARDAALYIWLKPLYRRKRSSKKPQPKFLNSKIKAAIYIYPSISNMEQLSSDL